MNKIRLQDLTPDVYYNTSRDFQFIGRLFDVVLNSVKVNSEMLYNNPLSDNSDERLVDLMSMTLGFKSRHNYNVKQLTAMCSAFCEILRNKGNITSIETAINALLNAEGIKEQLGYSLSENNTILNLFIPQSLTDTNLLRDLLVYILPAGMSCNIIKEFSVEKLATTNISTTDTITEKPNINIAIKTTSIVPKIEGDISKALAGKTAGIMANSDVLQLADLTNGSK